MTSQVAQSYNKHTLSFIYTEREEERERDSFVVVFSVKCKQVTLLIGNSYSVLGGCSQKKREEIHTTLYISAY